MAKQNAAQLTDLDESISEAFVVCLPFAGLHLQACLDHICQIVSDRDTIFRYFVV